MHLFHISIFFKDISKGVLSANLFFHRRNMDGMRGRIYSDRPLLGESRVMKLIPIKGRVVINGLTVLVLGRLPRV